MTAAVQIELPAYDLAVLPPNVAKRVQVDPVSGCWRFTGAITSRGYGCAGVGHGKTDLVHRIAYRAVHGEIPEGAVIDHRRLTRPVPTPPGTGRTQAARSPGDTTKRDRGSEPRRSVTR